jgi:limonene-1,2-epoxide hydrolase
MPMNEINRRDFLAASGAAAVVGMSGSAEAGQGQRQMQTSAAEQANIKIVSDFCAAWSTRDPKQILPFFAEDGTYRMSETTPPVTGPGGIMERLGDWIRSSDKGIEFKVLETYARGPMVVNHRVDSFRSSTRPLTWEGVGVFFVKDGKIKEWNDYTMKVDRG